MIYMIQTQDWDGKMSKYVYLEPADMLELILDCRWCKVDCYRGHNLYATVSVVNVNDFNHSHFECSWTWEYEVEIDLDEVLAQAADICDMASEDLYKDSKEEFAAKYSYNRFSKDTKRKIAIF